MTETHVLLEKKKLKIFHCEDIVFLVILNFFPPFLFILVSKVYNVLSFLSV